MTALKTRLKATWMSGDYGHFAQYLEAGAIEFLDRLNLQPGTRMLDVACGAGQIAIPAARAGIKVAGVDIAPNLIEQARTRANFEGLSAQFDEGDAEMLPYDDCEFDVVVSLIGAMFAPRPEYVASELVRVCRPGGRIVMANWTPRGHVGQMFRRIAQHVPPPAPMASPVQWGDEEVVRNRFRNGVSGLRTTIWHYPMRYPFPPRDVVDFFGTYYGPTVRAFESLDEARQAVLKSDLVELWEANNIARNNQMTHVESEYLEVVVDKA